MKTDQELLNLIFTDLFQNNGCDDIKVMLQEKYQIEIDTDHRQRLFRLCVATGFAKADNYAYGNHPHISITDEGVKMMQVYENYSNYLLFLKRDIKEERDSIILNNANIRLNNWKLVIALIASIIAIIGLIINLIGTSNENDSLKELLHKNNIEIPK